MKMTPLFILFTIVVLVIGVVHITALELALYWQYQWLDMPVHLLGGMAIVLGILVLRERHIFVKDRHITFVPLLLIVLSVGLAWEVFEIWAGIPIIEDDFEKDMVIDLLMGLAGGSLGWFIGVNPLRR